MKSANMKKTRKKPKTKSRPVSTQLQTLLQQAERLFGQSQYRQALEIARLCLTLAPQNIGLLNFAGVCAISLGDLDGAEQFWRQAITRGCAIPETYFNLGLLLAKSQRQEEAGQCYRRAISLSLDPYNALAAQAYCNLGNLLGDSAEAEACYRAAIAIDPQFEAALYNLGNRLLQREAWEETEQCYRQAIATNPADPQVHAKLGQVLAQRQQMAEAEQAYRQAIALDPGCAEAHANLGLLLEDSQRLEGGRPLESGRPLEDGRPSDEAERCYLSAVALNPDSPEILSNLANLLAQSDRVDEAEQCYRKALQLDPAYAPAYCNLGALLATHKRENVEAEQCFRQALACNPEYALAQFNLGQLLLCVGRLEEGWAYHEARYAKSIPNQTTVIPTVSAAQWQGEPLAGKSLLVVSEQGFGDAIQFCRYLPLLKEQGAAHLTLKCRAELKALFATLAGVDTLMDSEEQNIPPHDYWTFLHSIPFRCKTTLQTIPARIPYLHAPQERLARWADHLSGRLPAGSLRVGLAWKGNRIHSNDGRRSLAGLAVLKPLWSVPGVTFVSLQKGQGEDEAAHPPADQPLLDLGADFAKFADFGDTAAIVECLDLVISVDTSVAHLAGALGKPCWVMLPDFKTDWRWLREGDVTPWYPETMQLFRQKKRGDWEPVVAGIARALAVFTARAHAR